MTSQATSAAAITDSKDLLVVGTVQLPDTTCQKKDSRQEKRYWQTHCRLSQFALRRMRILIFGMQGLVSWGATWERSGLRTSQAPL